MTTKEQLIREVADQIGATVHVMQRNSITTIEIFSPTPREAALIAATAANPNAVTQVTYTKDGSLLVTIIGGISEEAIQREENQR